MYGTFMSELKLFINLLPGGLFQMSVASIDPILLRSPSSITGNDLILSPIAENNFILSPFPGNDLIPHVQ
jgi:hypothetical protein